MQVRILSGNETGKIVDLPQVEAENAIATGYAELYDAAKDQAALDANNASEKKFAKAAKRKTAARKKAATKKTPAKKKGPRRTK